MSEEIPRVGRLAGTLYWLPTGASTGTWEHQPGPASAPTVYNIAMLLANTEYSQAIPVYTKMLRFRARGALQDVRYAWVTGKVAGPATPYLTLMAGMDYSLSDIHVGGLTGASNLTLYVACAIAGLSIELECWV